ncbi:exo-alpha-sialidase [Trypanosoma cruzi]|nr:exo-alpha-sialidase [Trypanosoma cruzi]
MPYDKPNNLPAETVLQTRTQQRSALLRNMVDGHRRHNSESVVCKAVLVIILPAVHRPCCPGPRSREFEPVFDLRCLLRSCIHAALIVDPRVVTGRIGQSCHQTRRGYGRLGEEGVQSRPSTEGGIDRIQLISQAGK